MRVTFTMPGTPYEYNDSIEMVLVYVPGGSPDASAWIRRFWLTLPRSWPRETPWSRDILSHDAPDRARQASTPVAVLARLISAAMLLAAGDSRQRHARVRKTERRYSDRLSSVEARYRWVLVPWVGRRYVHR